MAYLVDTNILSHVVREPRGPIAARLLRAGDHNVFTSIVVAGELRLGAEKRGSQRLSANVDDVLSRIRIAVLEQPVDRVYAKTRAALEKVGAPIGANDTLIAAHALATDSILVTDNVKEFSRVPGLKIENWLR